MMTMQTRRDARKRARQKSLVTIEDEFEAAAPEIDASAQAGNATAKSGEMPQAATPPAREQASAAGADSPLEYMLRVMRDPAVEPGRRDEMAKLALPYLHPKPAAIEHTGRGGGPIEISDVSEMEIARRIGFLMTRGRQDKPQH